MPRLSVADLAATIADHAPSGTWGELVLFLHRLDAQEYPLARSLLQLCTQLRRALPPGSKCRGVPVLECVWPPGESQGVLRLLWYTVRAGGLRDGWWLEITDPGRAEVRGFAGDDVAETRLVVRWQEG